MLGDLTAERTHIKDDNRLRFYMSLRNKDLIYYFYSIFKSYVKTGPKIINWELNKLTKGLYTKIRFFIFTLKFQMFDWVI